MRLAEVRTVGLPTIRGRHSNRPAIFVPSRGRALKPRIFCEVLLALLELGDIGITATVPPSLSATFADHDPAAIVAPLHLRLGLERC